MTTLGVPAFISPIDAIKQIQAILNTYISKNGPWADSAQTQLTAFNNTFPLPQENSPDIHHTFDALKDYIIQNLAPQFNVTIKWLFGAHGGSTLREHLEKTANEWPTQQQYLEQRAIHAETQLKEIKGSLGKAPKSSDNESESEKVTRIQALETALHQLEQQMQAEISRIQELHAKETSELKKQQAEQTEALSEQLQQLKLESEQAQSERLAQLQGLNTQLILRLKAAQEELANFKSKQPESAAAAAIQSAAPSGVSSSSYPAAKPAAPGDDSPSGQTANHQPTGGRKKAAANYRKK